MVEFINPHPNYLYIKRVLKQLKTARAIYEHEKFDGGKCMFVPGKNKSKPKQNNHHTHKPKGAVNLEFK